MTTLPGAWTSTAEILGVIRGRCSPADINALIAKPDGLAVAAMLVQIASDNLARINRSICARHLIARPSDDAPAAAGEARATVNLLLGRSKASVGQERVVSAGTRVISDDGHVYTLDTAHTFAPGAWEPEFAAATALFPGYSSTVIPDQINAFDAVANGAVGDLCTVEAADALGQQRLVRVYGDFFLRNFVGGYMVFTGLVDTDVQARVVEVSPDGEWCLVVPDTPLMPVTAAQSWEMLEWSTLGFTVSQPYSSTQGVLDGLDALGRELGRPRQTGEDDTQLRDALINLTDAVTPEAIKRLVDRILGAYGTCRIYELTALAGASDGVSFMPFPGIIADMTPCDVSPDFAVGVTPGPPGLRPPPSGLAMVGPEGNAFFIVEIPGDVFLMLGEVGGCAYADHFGVSTDPPAGGVPGFPRSMAADVSPCDGIAYEAAAIRRSIAAQLNLIKGAGVSWAFAPRTYYTP